MAKKKRRKSKKNKGNLTLIIMLAVIFITIGIFVFKAINKDTGGENLSTTAPSDYYQGDNSVDYSYYNSGEQGETEEDTQLPETTEAEASTTTEEPTTEPLTLPINSEPENMVDVILDYYTDLMGFPDGALFIKESETEETASGYTYTLRLNAKGSPNELIGDVYVEKGTGKVTDSMGNDSWNIED